MGRFTGWVRKLLNRPEPPAGTPRGQAPPNLEEIVHTRAEQESEVRKGGGTPGNVPGSNYF